MVRSVINYNILDTGVKKSFLMDNHFTQDAMLYGFVTYFKSTNPVKAQIWRQVVDSTYELVFQLEMQPTLQQLNARTGVSQ